MAKRRVNKYPKAFRLMAVERMRNCDNVSVLAKELGVDRSVLYHWRNLMPIGRGAGPRIASAKTSTGLLGEGTQTPSLPQSPSWLGNQPDKSAGDPVSSGVGGADCLT